LLIVVVGHAREVPVTILHTCDLHGHILPTVSYEGQTNLGGVARCATVIGEVRAKERNVLLVDAGDTIQGAPVAFLSDGLVMVKALNLLRYDAWCWGNHEFDWGLEKLATCAEAARVPILNANLRAGPAPRDSATRPTPADRILAIVKPYRILNVEGVRVAIIGLNTPGIPNWSRPRLIAGLAVADSIETLRTVVPAVKRDGADVLVLVCHQGYREQGDDHANQINAIARNFPELDVIIGGHTHRHFPEYKVNNVLYCQANYHGLHLGRVDLTFDTAAQKLVRRESRTIAMDEKYPLDAAVLRECGAELDRAAKILGTVIGTANGALDIQGGPKRPTASWELLCAAIAGALRTRGLEVDGVVHGILDRRATLAAGPVTIGDVWRLVPYENTMGVMELTPAQLRAVLDENVGAYERRDFRGLWGLKAVYRPGAAPGERVVAVRRADGSPIAEGERLRVAFNSYELASGGLRWFKLRELAADPQTKLVEYDFQTRQAVVDYIRARGAIEPVTQEWWTIRK
jgi:2',3'-cyclic-nucleotide 2'-phosphodiesterase (5'-nucleotidase family)